MAEQWIIIKFLNEFVNPGLSLFLMFSLYIHPWYHNTEVCINFVTIVKLNGTMKMVFTPTSLKIYRCTLKRCIEQEVGFCHLGWKCLFMNSFSGVNLSNTEMQSPWKGQTKKLKELLRKIKQNFQFFNLILMFHNFPHPPSRVRWVG